MIQRNYSAEATDDDGSCEFTSCVGCADSTACNYNPDATEDDGSCNYPAEDYLDCAGSCLSDVDADGICDELEVPGCTDMMACNYDPNATDDNGSCAYTDGVYDCDGITCLADADGDGVCDPNEVSGCTDSMAVNFDSSATDDDGSWSTTLVVWILLQLIMILMQQWTMVLVSMVHGMLLQLIVT